ncbi:hypothetical protein CUMW_226370 [Citrus unshiu]|uniref:PGG domain-containing protein n=1 Tax=Citrus unshiu TaxID=55188 RepID=A0A2H5QFX6_CITUN|nr:hypothetical protein CUMW_226370 [Citrus unshiu]
MNSDLYKAAAKGEIEPFNQLAIDRQLGSIVTHKKNTVLHVSIIASYTQNKEGESVSTKFVEKILEKCPSLLLQVNAKGDSSLHVAARYGHAAVVGALIEIAEKQPGQELESGVKSTTRYMLGMKNDEDNTALHEAVQSGSLDVVKILLGADRAFPYSANGSGETPLYLAAAGEQEEIVDEILQKCPSPAHEGPNRKTALHAAVCSGSLGVIERLVDRKKCLTRERDQHGWTPLHYAAYLDHLFISFHLLRADKSAALIADEDRKMTALHLAAGQGNAWIVQVIIYHCPECCELVDVRGWNVLHFAMVSFYERDLKDLVDEYPVVKNLIFEKDVKGNTPFHVLAAVCPHPGKADYDIVPWKIAKGYYQAVNKQNISVEHINRYGFPELAEEIEKLSKADGSGNYPDGVIKINKNKKRVIYSYWKDLDEDVIGMEKASEYHLVVAALIATVTFAAAFTLPGGYKSDTEDGPNRGTAILSKNAAFQAFVISDAIAMGIYSAVLIPNEDRKMTALHLAAGQGNVWIVQQIIERCPECCELVDDRGWNVLHFAMAMPAMTLSLGKYYQAVNKQNIGVEHINRYGFPELEKEIEELSKADGSGQYPDGVVKMNKKQVHLLWKYLDENVFGVEKASEYHLVVAALIATVTFAAAFTLPGGYKSDTDDGPNRGTAILNKNVAFQAFVISDAIAMVLSLSAVLVHFILSLKLFEKFIFLFSFSLWFTLVAMAAMIIAFVTGTYAVLAPSLGLAIVTCIIGLTFFFLVIFMFYKVRSKAEEMEDED